MEQLITICVGFVAGYFVCRKYDNSIYLKWVDFKINYKKILKKMIGK
jgi:hypothetical protein